MVPNKEKGDCLIQDFDDDKAGLCTTNSNANKGFMFVSLSDESDT